MSGITEELREAMHCTNGYSFARDFVFEECCDRIDASFDQFQAENDILRKQVAEACRQLGGAWVRCVELSELVADMWRTMNLLDACAVDEYDEPMNCNTCEQWGNVDELASGARVIGCRLMWRMAALGIEVER